MCVLWTLASFVYLCWCQLCPGSQSRLEVRWHNLYVGDVIKLCTDKPVQRRQGGRVLAQECERILSLLWHGTTIDAMKYKAHTNSGSRNGYSSLVRLHKSFPIRFGQGYGLSSRIFTENDWTHTANISNINAKDKRLQHEENKFMYKWCTFVWNSTILRTLWHPCHNKHLCSYYILEFSWKYTSTIQSSFYKYSLFISKPHGKFNRIVKLTIYINVNG